MVGYDNDKYLASNEAYNDLDKCCQYLRKELPKTKVDVMLPIKEVDNLNASISDNLEDPKNAEIIQKTDTCLLYTSPSPRDRTRSRMPSSA